MAIIAAVRVIVVAAIRILIRVVIAIIIAELVMVIMKSSKNNRTRNSVAVIEVGLVIVLVRRLLRVVITNNSRISNNYE